MATPAAVMIGPAVERLRDLPSTEALGEHEQAHLGIALSEHSGDAYRRPDQEDDRADAQQDPAGAVGDQHGFLSRDHTRLWR
jgi:hypothetical protein